MYVSTCLLFFVGGWWGGVGVIVIVSYYNYSCSSLSLCEERACVKTISVAFPTFVTGY